MKGTARPTRLIGVLSIPAFVFLKKWGMGLCGGLSGSSGRGAGCRGGERLLKGRRSIRRAYRGVAG